MRAMTQRMKARVPECVRTGGEDVLYSFRDGITVKLVGQERTSWRKGTNENCAPLPQPTDADLASFIEIEVATVARYGRTAGVPRQVYAACTGDNSVLPAREQAPDEAWRRIVSASQIAAWNSDRYSLLELVTRAIVSPSGGCRIDVE